MIKLSFLKNIYKISFSFLFLLLILSSNYACANKEKAVTYELGGGRFGDKLICYLHAKWISYKHNIPLLYKPFPYSNQLALDQIEAQFNSSYLEKYKKTITLNYKQELNYNDKKKSVLYIIPYFPECLWEHKPADCYPYFSVNWEDVGFRKTLKEVLKPLYTKPQIELPDDRVTVAIHVRHGGGFDTNHTRRHAPLKLPPESFYIAQIETIYQLLDRQPLYIHIFTDHKHPLEILKRFEAAHTDKDIVWNARSEGNHHTANVVQDFIEMTRFDCLIRPESNYSIVASKIADHKIIIKPVDFKIIKDVIFINRVEIEKAYPPKEDSSPRIIERYQIDC